MALGDKYKVLTCCYITGQISLNTFYVEITNVVGVEPSDLQKANAIDAIFAPLYKPLMPPAATYYGVAVQKEGAPPGPLIGTSVNSGGGTGAGGFIATQVSFLASRKTALGGRHGRGRIYPGFPDSSHMNTNGQPKAAAVALIQTLANVQLTTINAVTIAPAGNCDMQFRLKNIILGGTFYDPIVSVAASTRFATQRRRGDYGRLNPLPW